MVVAPLVKTFPIFSFFEFQNSANNKLHPGLLMYHQLQSELRKRGFLDLFDALNSAVASVCPWDCWFWHYKQKCLKFRQPVPGVFCRTATCQLARCTGWTRNMLNEHKMYSKGVSDAQRATKSSQDSAETLRVRSIFKVKGLETEPNRGWFRLVVIVARSRP